MAAGLTGAAVTPVPRQAGPQSLRYRLQTLHGRWLHEARVAAEHALIGDSHHRDRALVTESVCIEHAHEIAELLWGDEL